VEKLDDVSLCKAYKDAIIFQLDEAFISLLLYEIKERKLENAILHSNEFQFQ
jgi:hypothetical protein